MRFAGGFGRPFSFAPSFVRIAQDRFAVDPLVDS